MHNFFALPAAALRGLYQISGISHSLSEAENRANEKELTTIEARAERGELIPFSRSDGNIMLLDVRQFQRFLNRDAVAHRMLSLTEEAGFETCSRDAAALFNHYKEEGLTPDNPILCLFHAAGLLTNLPPLAQVPEKYHAAAEHNYHAYRTVTKTASAYQFRRRTLELLTEVQPWLLMYGCGSIAYTPPHLHKRDPDALLTGLQNFEDQLARLSPKQPDFTQALKREMQIAGLSLYSDIIG